MVVMQLRGSSFFGLALSSSAPVVKSKSLKSTDSESESESESDEEPRAAQPAMPSYPSSYSSSPVNHIQLIDEDLSDTEDPLPLSQEENEQLQRAIQESLRISEQ
jgi:hypothetical protein